MPITDVPDAFLQTIVRQIALMLYRGAGGDLNAAQTAAGMMISSHNPRTEAELRMVARIICFSLQAGEALAQAAHPEMPMARVLCLRTGAVSLNREAQKAERQLAKLQQDMIPSAERQPQPQPQPEPESPRIEKTAALVTGNHKVADYAKAHGLTFSQALQYRERDKRLAERQRKHEARQQKADPVPAFA